MFRALLGRSSRLLAFIPLALPVLIPHLSVAQDKPYFVTYSQDLEEPGNLEIETKSALGKPIGGDRYGALAGELEYGATAWWTTELYLDGQSTANESTIPTGVRWENRFRMLMKEHAVNPVLYVEFENITAADKNILEVVGHDGQADLADANAGTRQDHKHEGELKFILSSNVHDWNISENFIAEKNLGHDPWEFGYAAAISRPLSTAYRECSFCIQKVTAGAEAYGGLGNTWALTMRDTSHYVAPVFGWYLPKQSRLTFSPGFGLTGSSLDRVYRVGFAIEIPQFSRFIRGGR